MKNQFQQKKQLDNDSFLNTKETNNTVKKPGIRQYLGKALLSFFDQMFIKYLTVERSRGRRKYIWKTQSFKEIFYIHIPRCLFIFGMVYASSKINNRAKKFKNYLTNEVEVNSEREDNVTNESKKIDYFLRLPNEFDPSKTSEALSVEFKDVNKYDYDKLDDEDLERLEEVNIWVEKLNNKYKF